MPENEYDALDAGGGITVPSTNEYDEIAKAVDEDRASKLKAAFYSARDTNPDQHARSLKVAKALNVPVPTAARNLDQAEGLASFRGNEYDQIVERTPKLAEWLQEHDNAVLSKDDVEHLRGISEHVSGKDYYGPARGDTDHITIAREDAIREGSLAGYVRTLPVIRNVLALASGIPQGVKDLGGAIAYAGEIAGIEGAGKMQQDLAKEADAIGAERSNLSGGPLERGVNAVTGGVARVATNLVAPLTIVRGLRYFGMAPKLAGYLGHGGNAAVMGASQADLQADESGLKGWTKAAYVLEHSATEAGFTLMMGLRGSEIVGQPLMPVITDTFRRYLAYAGHAGGEILEENATNLAHELLDQINLPENKDRTTGEVFNDWLRSVPETTAVSGIVGGGARWLGDPGRVVREARRNEDYFTALGNGVKESKTFQRLPAAMQSLIERQTKDGPVENMYAPIEVWNQYWQAQKVDPRAVAKQVMGETDSYDQAAAAGHDLIIPTARYAVTIAATDHNAFFAKELRTSPTAMSAREGMEFAAEMEAQAKREVQPEAAPDESAGLVRDDVLKQLKAAGLEGTVADAKAAQVEAVFRSLGQRAGIAPFDLYERYGLSVTRKLPEGLRAAPVDSLDPLLDRLRGGDIPKQQDIFGTSLVEFLRETGLKDPGGDLASMEVNKTTKPFQKHLVRADGIDPDEAAARAVEAGYLKEHDINALLAAIQEEIAGRPVYREGQENPTLLKVRLDLEEMQSYLKDLGVDLQRDDNAAVKQILESQGAGQVEPMLEAAQTTLDQSGASGTLTSDGRPGTVLDERDGGEPAVSSADAGAGGLVGGGELLRAWGADREHLRVEARRKRYQVPGQQSFLSPEGKLEQEAARGDTHPSDDDWLTKLLNGVAGTVLPGARITNLIDGLVREEIPNVAILRGTVVETSRDAAILLAAYRSPFVERTTWLLLDKDGVVKHNGLWAVGTIDGAMIPGPLELAELVKAIGGVAGDQMVWAHNHPSGDPTPSNADNLVYTGMRELLEQMGIGFDGLVLNGEKFAHGVSTPEAGFGKYVQKEFHRGGDGLRVTAPADVAALIKGLTTTKNSTMLIHTSPKMQVVGVEAFNEQPDLAAVVASRNASGAAVTIIVGVGVRPKNVAYDERVADLIHLDGDTVTSLRSDGVYRPSRESTDKDQVVNIVKEGGDVRYEQGKDVKRGSIRFGKDRQFAIALFEQANLSTFLHESGHFYLEVLGDLAHGPNATESISNDYQSILKWMGVQSRGDIKAEHHEQFARGFEAYLREGRAPSVALAGAFAKFKAWLIAIYRSIADLDVTLSDEIRGVMDRMLATDAEIAEARDRSGHVPVFTDAKAAGMTDAEFAAYQATVDAVKQEAEARLLQTLMDDYQKEQAAWWQAELEQVRAGVREDIESRKDYIALYAMRFGTMPNGGPLPDGVKQIKFNKAALEEIYGKANRKKGEPQNQVMNKLLSLGLYSKDGGIHQQQAAELFGYRSGDELVMTLVNLPKKEAAIRKEADEIMEKRHPDMHTTAAAAHEAIRAIHNEKRSDLLVSEVNRLAIRSGQRAAPLELLRDRAKKTIAEMKVRNVAPQIYERAERRAAKAAFAAAAKDDFAQALVEKQRELYNHELYRAAANAKEMVEKTVEYMAKFQQKPTRARIGLAGADYLQQIDAILSRYDFRKVSNKAFDKKKALEAWALEQQEQGIPISLPEDVLNDALEISYKEISVGALEGVRDAVKTIEHLARFKNRLLANDKMRTLQEAKAAITGSIGASHTIAEEAIDFAPGLGKRIVQGAKGLFAAHTKLEFLYQWLDGNKALGPTWQALFKPMIDAETRENDMMRGVTENLGTIFGAYSRHERAKWHFTKTHIPAIGTAMTKANMLAVALNQGNAYNREAVKEGYQWNDAQVQSILDLLDERDWQTVQAIWDYVDTFWPAIEQQEKDLVGVAPEKVEASRVHTRFGTFKGGYYPVVFDAQLSFKQAKLEAKSAANDLFGGSWARAVTKKGHTKERQGTGGKPIKLDLSGLTTHLTNVVHDLSHRKALIDVSRIANTDEVRTAIEGTAGKAMYRQIHPWLANIASDRREYAHPIEAILGRARMGATVVNMGWKATTAITQVLGYTTTIKELGPVYAGKGLAAAYGSLDYKPWREAWEFASTRSALIRDRMTHFDRDVRDNLKKLNVAGVKAGVLGVVDNYTADVRATFFTHIGIMDMGVSLPSWMGGYQKAMDGAVDGIDAGDEKAAVDYADQIVRLTQGAGSAKDLALVQRGSDTYRMFSMFYSAFSVLFNQFQKSTGQLVQDKNAGRFVASMAMLWFLPAVLSELIVGRGPDEDEEWLPWMLKKEAAYPFQTIVGVRDIINGMDPKFGYELSPVGDAIGSLSRLGQSAGKAFDEDKDLLTGDAKNAVNAFGYVFQLPTRQLWLTGEYFLAWLTGEEEPGNPMEAAWRAAVTGKPRE